MTEFQAALLLQQMTRLEEQSRRREQNAAYLTEQLKEIPGIAPARMYEGCTRNAYHLYMFRYDRSPVPGPAAVAVSRGASRRGDSGLGRLSAARQGAVPEEHAAIARISGDLRPRADLGVPREESTARSTTSSARQAVWLTQTMLLGPRSDMDQIAEAVRKIQDSGKLALRPDRSWLTWRVTRLARSDHTSQSATACFKPSSGSRVGMNSWPTWPL